MRRKPFVRLLAAAVLLPTSRFSIAQPEYAEATTETTPTRGAIDTNTAATLGVQAQLVEVNDTLREMAATTKSLSQTQQMLLSVIQARRATTNAEAYRAARDATAQVNIHGTFGVNAVPASF